MDLTARDIEQKRFNDAWRGYNQEEVDDFLDRVAEALDRTHREVQALRRRTADLEQTVAASKNTEDMLKKTLLTAQRAAEEAIGQARAKAETLVAEAEARARSAADEARDRAARLETEARSKAQELDRVHATRKQEIEASIERLRAFEAELKGRLKTFLEQQLRALDTLAAAPVRGRPQPRPVVEAARPAAAPVEREATEPAVAVDNGDGGRRSMRNLFGRAEG